MIYVTFYLHRAKSPISPIYVRVHPGDFRASTHLSVEPKYWALRGKKVPRGTVVNKWLTSSHPYALEWNQHLRELNDKVHSAYYEAQREGRPLEEVDLAGIIDPGARKARKKEGPRTVREYLERWAEKYVEKKLRGIKDPEERATRKGKVEDYTRSYKQVVDKLEEYMPGIRPEQINEETVEAFEEWVLNHEEYNVQYSTVQRYRKILRTAMKEAGLPYEWLQVGAGEVSTKYDLTWEEVLQLRDASYSKESLRRAAHTFVIQCQLALRFGDVSSLKPVHFEQIKLEKYGEVTVVNRTQGKTGDLVYVPIPSVAAQLMEEHGGIPVLRTRSGKISLQKYNEYLKDAAKEAKLTRLVRQTKSYANGRIEESQVPLSAVISSHDARHTGASRVLAVSKDPALVKKLLGHKGRDVTERYSHYNPMDVAERLLDAWQVIEASKSKA
ncbi:integrase-like protein [Pontibacter ummariensis]|uniref:Phage integrase SAM-like domain-containing protein n=1 Tax=Pontibacter ummariensis TaxID=1610492 RepID=A0A239HM16_9BACT|nr:tyrosine-type recombinase/integrase [Pontibacter ummariensis]PRY10332.1 integrase-like protein [Pontibacter ummariensis]SNS82436.1 Phage integrase SAM-like domain-containing protein [Pontibacter ummariensis]